MGPDTQDMAFIEELFFPSVPELPQFFEDGLGFEPSAINHVNIGYPSNTVTGNFLIATIRHFSLVLTLLDEGMTQTMEVFVMRFDRKPCLFPFVEPNGQILSIALASGVGQVGEE